MPKIGLIGFLFCFSLSGFAQTPKWKAWEVEADTLLEHQDFKGAIVLYTKVLKKTKLKDREAFGSLYKRAVSYYSMGAFANALSDLDIFIPAYPQVPQAKLLRALVYKGLGDTEKQLLDLNEALTFQQGNPGLLKWRASLYLDDGKYELARQDAERAREIEDDAEVEMYLGFALYYLGQFEESLKCINKSIEYDAAYLPSYLYGGTFCLEQEEYDKALQYLNLALRLDPQNVTATMYKGIALVELEKTEEGCKCLRKAFYAGEDSAEDYLKEYCYGIEN
jgi:tetratricopeptide (TPR) repeat protein